MSIFVDVKPSGSMEIHVAANVAADFRNLVQRGTNLWPDAPAHIKWLADIVTSGRPMQDYFTNPHLSGKIHANPSDKN